MAEIECENHFNPNNSNHVSWFRRRISAYYARGVRFFGLYIDNNIPVGMSVLLIDEGPEGVLCMSQKSELLDIGIFPEFRDERYGSELLKHAEELSKNSGVYCMYVSTYAANYQAIYFYGRNGYVPVATLPDIHGPGDEYMIYMRKILRK